MALTFQEFADIVEKHEIPKDAEIWSDTKWECSAVDLYDVYYSRKKNVIVLAPDTPHEDEELGDLELLR